MTASPSVGSAPAEASTLDAVTRRALDDLHTFTSWLSEHHVCGFIGEVGWPDDAKGDAAQWNALAERWFRAADRARLWVAVWATGEWWGTNYALAPYEASSDGAVDTTDTQAPVIERHLGTARILRGVNVAGGEFGAPSVSPTSSFSNRNPGAYGSAYHYDTSATFRYLRSRGLRLVRIPFRWERIQPRPGGALSAAEVRRLKAVVGRAHAAGLRVILDMHNYAGYYEDEGGLGVRRNLGDRGMLDAFANVWHRIGRSFRSVPGLVGFDLMNEPVDISPSGGLTPEALWRKASQAAVSGIRSAGDGRLVLVEGYDWSGAQVWKRENPRPWIHDPAHRVRYEAHQYFDLDHSGTYTMTYDQVNAALGG
jgi:endoglucanase